MVPVSTFALGSQGEFNEISHPFLYKTGNGVNKKGAIKNDALDDYGIFLVSLLVSPLVSK